MAFGHYGFWTTHDWNPSEVNYGTRPYIFHAVFKQTAIESPAFCYLKRSKYPKALTAYAFDRRIISNEK